MSEYTNKEIWLWTTVLAVILGAIGVIQYLVWEHENAARILWIIGGVFLLGGLLMPTLMRPVYWVWMKIAIALAWFNTRLIMFIGFYFVFTPVGIILKIMRKDLIKEKWDKGADSYWIVRPKEPFDPSRYEKQY